MKTNGLTFPFVLGFGLLWAAAGAFLLLVFLLRSGGRGDADRLARGPDDSASSGVKREVRESFGGTTNPGWGRDGLGGQRVRRLADDEEEIADAWLGTWRELEFGMIKENNWK